MKLRTKYLVFVGVLHLLTLSLSFLIFEKNKIYFLLAEVFILISMVISWQLYNQMIRPLRLLVQGADAIRDGDFNVKFVESGTYEMSKLIGVYNQMIDELRKERTLQQQQHFFLDKLILGSPVGIIILDHDQRIQQVNFEAKKILHSIPFEGWLLKDIDHPLMDEVRTLLSTQEKSATLTEGSKTYKLQVSEFIDRGFSRHFVLIQELTNELLQAEKQAYGNVIRMMAHEVNNTVGPVNSILDFALTIETGRAEESRLANALQVAMDRNNNLNIFMRNLADVVRLPEPRKTQVDLHELLHSVTTLLSENARLKGIDFKFVLNKVPLIVFADQLQLEQVLINMVKNAIEAITGGEGGVITFLTSTLPLQLIVRDNGKGISAEAAPHLFSPFFSTKVDGQGIGLTLIKDVLIKHGFPFSLQENPAGETEFTITLSTPDVGIAFKK